MTWVLDMIAGQRTIARHNQQAGTEGKQHTQSKNGSETVSRLLGQHTSQIVGKHGTHTGTEDHQKRLSCGSDLLARHHVDQNACDNMEKNNHHACEKIAQRQHPRVVGNIVDQVPGKDDIVFGGADGQPKMYRMFRNKARKIGDDFNLFGLSAKVPHFSAAIDMVRGCIHE